MRVASVGCRQRPSAARGARPPPEASSVAAADVRACRCAGRAGGVAGADAAARSGCGAVTTALLRRARGQTACRGVTGPVERGLGLAEQGLQAALWAGLRGGAGWRLVQGAGLERPRGAGGWQVIFRCRLGRKGALNDGGARWWGWRDVRVVCKLGQRKVRAAAVWRTQHRGQGGRGRGMRR